MSNELNQDAQEQTEIDAVTAAGENQAAEPLPTEATSEEMITSLEARVAELQDSLKLEKARAANAIYDAAKVKERLEREADTAKKFVLEKFAKDVLNSVDNLERAIQAAGDDTSALLDGVKLTHKSLLSTLEKFDVLPVNTQNGFNAELHQAVGIDPSAKAGEIANVLQQGYTLAGRLLRPAMVMVGQ